jgi:hypothetical protein
VPTLSRRLLQPAHDEHYAGVCLQAGACAAYPRQSEAGGLHGASFGEPHERDPIRRPAEKEYMAYIFGMAAIARG